MTREQEIKKRLFEISTSNFNNSVVDSSAYFAGYMDGAVWADAHPDIDVRTMAAWQSGYKEAIDKACEWLREELDKEEDRHYIHVHGFDKECREIFLEQFCKAMKGGNQ